MTGAVERDLTARGAFEVSARAARGEALAARMEALEERILLLTVRLEEAEGERLWLLERLGRMG